MSGLPSFDDEYAAALLVDLGSVRLMVLPLERIFLSKRTANRDEDRLPIEQIERTLRILKALAPREEE